MPSVNSSADDSGDWSERLNRVRQRAADEFRDCSDDSLELLRICARYFQHGEQEGFDFGALIDYLGVSTPSVLDMAGFSDALAIKVMNLLPLLKEDKDGVCRAPDDLPPTPQAIPASIQARFGWDKQPDV